LKHLFKHQYYSALLLAGDVLGMLLAFRLAHYLHVGRALHVLDWTFFAVILTTLMFLYIFNSYTPDYSNRGLAILVRTSFGVIAAAMVASGDSYIIKVSHADPVLWRGTLIVGYFLFFIYAGAARVLVSRILARINARRSWVVIGDSAHLKTFKEAFKTAGIGSGLLEIELGSEGLDKNTLDQALSKDKYEGIVISTTRSQLLSGIERELMHKRLSGVKVYAVTDFFEKYLWKIPIDFLEESWIALAQGFDLVHHKVQLNVKRTLDFIFAVTVLVVSLPIMVITYFLVKFNSKGRAIFTQVRVGKNGEKFTLYKFRTMYDDAEDRGPQWAQEHDPRVTKVGRILRRTRVDELPQLWNVLKGEMSFIGPRPERPDFVEKLEKMLPYYELRSLVAPGITGWAQVMYPYGASVEDAKEKLQYDLYYIKNYSLALDIVIVVKTLRVVFRAAGR